MTNAEIIKALRYCAEHEGCDYYIAKDCPRESTWMCGVDCGQVLMLDAADALEAAEKRIAELMPKEGKWIEEPMTREKFYNDPYLSAKCSICGANSRERGHYCPNCGSRMRKGELL